MAPVLTQGEDRRRICLLGNVLLRYSYHVRDSSLRARETWDFALLNGNAFDDGEPSLGMYNPRKLKAGRLIERAELPFRALSATPHHQHYNVVGRSAALSSDWSVARGIKASTISN